MPNTDKTIFLPQLQRYDQKIKGWADNKFLTKVDTPSLPKATATTLGGVKVGSGLSVTDDGVLSAEDDIVFTWDFDTSAFSCNKTFAEVKRITTTGVRRTATANGLLENFSITLLVGAANDNGVMFFGTAPTNSLGSGMLGSRTYETTTYLFQTGLVIAYTPDGHIQMTEDLSDLITNMSFDFKNTTFKYDQTNSFDLKDGGITSTKIADSAITAAKLASGAVTSDKITNGAVSSVKIASNAVTEDKIADGAITAQKIKDGAITSAKLADGAVTAAMIEDGTITANKIADGVIDAVTDVRVNGKSITTDGVADIPVAKDNDLDSSNNTYGVVKSRGSAYGIFFHKDGVCTATALHNEIDSRKSSFKPIAPATLDYAVKAAMCDGKGAAWTDAEKLAAKERLGIGKYELIDSLVLEQDVSSIVRNTTPDGRSYSFSMLIVDVIMNDVSSSESVNLFFKLNDRYNTESVQTIDSNSPNYKARMFADVSHGFLDARFAKAAYMNTANSEPHQMLQTYELAAIDKITKFSLVATSGKMIPAGIKINIYGVWA